MDGWPVWLASASLRDRNGHIVSTERWSSEMFDRVSAGLDVLLDGIGDREREREFRMCITLCRHRALTPQERAALPDWWEAAPAVDIAGGPVEVRWYRGIPERPSTQPCLVPDKQNLSPGLWLPIDCGECEPCLDRKACHAPA